MTTCGFAQQIEQEPVGPHGCTATVQKATLRPPHSPGDLVDDAPLILIAEDDADNREGYAEYLTFLGYRVAQATNGEDALVWARQLHPDVLLLDLALPGVDGWEVARQLKSDSSTRSMLVIALSACVFPNDVLRATDAGCDLFLDKPCYPQTVADEIQRLLAARQLKTEN